MSMDPNIWDVLSDTKRIIKSQPRHYLTLYLIFLIPLSFLTLLFQHFLQQFQQQPPPNPIIFISLSPLFFIFSSIFTYAATISITYSVFHAFFNRPVKLKEAIKSISTSFFPLLATQIIIFVVSFVVIFLFLLLIGLIYFFIIHLIHVDLTFNSIMLSFMVLMIVLVPIVIYLSVNISLSHVIVVVESRWGFEPLRKSWKLVKGMKRLIISSTFIYGSLQGFLVTMISDDNWVLTLVISPIFALFSLNIIAVNTVLYIYCKKKHGEVAYEEFEKEKDGASLPLIP